MKQESTDLPFSIAPCNTTREAVQLLKETASFSVDCDTPYHYAYAFAPNELKPEANDTGWLELLDGIASIFRHLTINATFFCIANQLEDPSVLSAFQRLIEEGHEVGNHTYSHPEMHTLTPEQRTNEIIHGHETIQNKLGIAPKGYRAPAYYSSPEDLTRLSQMGYTYDASAYTSKLTRLAYRLFTAGYERQSKPNLPDFHFQYPGTTPSIMTFDDGNHMVEWPLPSPLGLAFLGTLHTITPKTLFLTQHTWMRAMGRHCHYALHLIELGTTEQGSWLPTLSSKYYPGSRNFEEWLTERLARIMNGKKNLTLGELSDRLLQM